MSYLDGHAKDKLDPDSPLPSEELLDEAAAKRLISFPLD